MKHYLPQLVDNHGVRVLPAESKWHGDGAQTCDAIGGGLQTGVLPVGVQSSQADVIPDIWARPLLFESALFSCNTQQQDRLAGPTLAHQIRGEWRGLLAILALRIRLGIDLQAVEVDLSSGTDPAVAPLHYTLAKMLPKKTISEDTFWSRLYVITYNDKPIGMTSPTTLVCTPCEYLHAIPMPVTWRKDGYLLDDPIRHLNSKERKGLLAWLIELRLSLSKHQRGSKSNCIEWNELSTQLNDYITDVTQSFGGQAPQDLPALSSDRVLGINSGVFRYLSRAAEGIPEKHSDVQLQYLRADGGTPARPLLVIDRQIADVLDRQPQDVIVKGTYTLANLPARDNRPGDADWFEGKDFFLPRLFKIPGQSFDQATTFNDWRIKSDESVILPINPRLLDYIPAAELARRLDVERQGGTIRVALRLPLGTETPFEYTITRTYEDQEIEPLTEELPAIEVWPDFTSPDWKHYFTFLALPDTQRHCFRVDPFPGPDATRPDTVSERSYEDFDVLRTVKYDRYPEAMLCRSCLDGTQWPFAGVLLLKPPRTVEGAGVNKMSIGVDFGTTATNIYADEGTGPVKLKFSRRPVRVTLAGDTVRSRAYREFMPPRSDDQGALERAANPPFLSLYHRIKYCQNPLPLLDGNILFVRPWTDDRNAPDNLNDSSIRGDLKWSDDPDDREHAGAYLHQVCLMASAEAAFRGAREVRWKFSYPTAFSEGRVHQFTNIWASIIGKIGYGIPQAGTGGTVSAQTVKPEPVTESAAVAQYFVSRHGANLGAAGMICLDIGGGTSDIAVWKGRRDGALQMQNSVKLAGRQTFLHHLFVNRRIILSELPVREFYLQAIEQVDEEQAYKTLETLVRDEGQNWLDSLSTNAPRRGHQHLLYTIGFGVAGLLYYTGLHIRYLNERAIENGQPAVFEFMPRIFAAGQGSKLFQWLGSGRWGDTCPYHHVIRSVLQTSTGFTQLDERTNWVVLSEEPKAEAAFGLVSSQQLMVPVSNQVLSGEEIATLKSTGVLVPASIQVANEEQLKCSQSIPELSRFIDSFNAAICRWDDRYSPFTLSSQEKLDISHSITEALLGYNQSPREVALEAPFIVGLRKLITLCAQTRSE